LDRSGSIRVLFLHVSGLVFVAPALLPVKNEVLVFVPRHSTDDLDKGLLWLSAECRMLGLQKIKKPPSRMANFKG
jgi:hypothetical protein